MKKITSLAKTLIETVYRIIVGSELYTIGTTITCYYRTCTTYRWINQQFQASYKKEDLDPDPEHASTGL
jgi:hypothetical protein